ncbi:glycosyltransferase [Vibrio breoganii]
MVKKSLSPLVSVVITTYKRPELLRRAIESVLNQTYKNIEVIVSDDNSNDHTSEVVRDYMQTSDIPIVYRTNTENKGACFTRNEGIKLANGYFVAGLDDDDEFTPSRIEKLVLNYSSDYSFVASNTLVKTKEGQYPLFSTKKVIELKDILWSNCIGSQILVEKEKLLSIGGFDQDLPASQDFDMWVRLIKEYGPALRLKETLFILHTEHEEPRISTSNKKVSGMSLVLKKYEHLMNDGQVKFRKYNIQMEGKEKRKRILGLYNIGLPGFIYLIKRKLRII